ncbi:MAG: right-handed parallel beta-helix repeat-containing protein [Planctomycetota bacterium]
MSSKSSDITTSLSLGISEKKSSLFSVSTKLLFWMFFVAILVGVVFQQLRYLTEKALARPEIILTPSMTLNQIQEEIDKAKSGSIFLLKKGVYYGKLFFKDKQDILLQGEEGTRIETNGTVLQIHNCQNLHLKNLHLEGTDKNSEEGVISVSRGTDLYLHEIRCSGNMVGLTLLNIDKVQIQNCIFKELKGGVKINQCEKISFQGNKIESNQEFGISCKESELQLDNKNQIVRNEKYGLYAETSRLILEKNNRISENANGIFMDQCLNSKITANEISKNSNTGISLKKCSQIVLESNQISENSSDGVFSEDTALEMRINILTRNGRGLVLNGRESKITLLNNTLQDHLNYGIYIQKSAKNGVVNAEHLKSSNLFQNNNGRDVFVEE